MSTNVSRRRTIARLGYGLASAAIAGTASVAAIMPASRARAEIRDAPQWMPPPGSRRNISENLLADVDPCPKNNCVYSGVLGQQAELEAWCGAAFADSLGHLGAWVTTGGGHGDYYGNEVYAFSLDTRRWIRLSDPYPGGPQSAVDYVEGEYAPGIPLSSHTYQHLQYLPPRLGGGPEGSLLLVVSYAAGKAARGSGRAHAFDLATRRWSRYSGNLASAGLSSTSGTCLDTKRGVYWRVPLGGGTIEYLSTRDRLFREAVIGSRGGNNFSLNQVAAYDPVRDWLIVLDWRGTEHAEVWALDASHAVAATQHETPAPARPTGPGRDVRWVRLDTKGSPPGNDAQGMGIEWCPSLRSFVGYPGRGATFVYKLVPPESAVSESGWHWTRENLDGDLPTSREHGPHMTYNRFRWAASIGCFIWATDRRLPVQAWRLHGT